MHGIKKRLLSIVLVFTLAVSVFPLMSFAADKDKGVKTYVFFGSDSRANDDSWRSPNGGKIKKDKSGTQGTPRSDVIMLFRVDNKKKTIDVVSVYRDTLLDVSGKGKDFQKANKAYSDLGPKKAVKALEKNLDIKIDGYVATNFRGVADVIDALGGVTITVEDEQLTDDYRSKKYNTVKDVMNGCINETNGIYGKKVPHVKKSGRQKLSGGQAVAYARVRYTEGGDMRRSVRQRTVLSAMSSKYRSSKPAVKAKVILAIVDNVETDIDPAVFASLVSKTASYKISTKSGFPYYKRAYTMKTKKEKEGISYVFVPCDLTTNVVKLHKDVYRQKKYKASGTVKSYSSRIASKTGYRYYSRYRNWDSRY